MLDFLLGIIPGGMLSELKTNIGVQGDITIDNIEKFVEDSKEEEAKKLEVKDNK